MGILGTRTIIEYYEALTRVFFPLRPENPNKFLESEYFLYYLAIMLEGIRIRGI
jgi:hypothetical protein